MSDLPDLVRVTQKDQSQEITAHLPSKEALKSMFALLVGNPDSIAKFFHKPMIIARDDIDKLDEAICTKLGIHQIEGSKTTFDLTLSDNTVLQFERWKDGNLNLALPQHVTAVRIRWDFMVRLPRYELPQRHVLTVRMGSDLNVARIMQAAFSRDPADVDSYELANFPLYCRVDFINQLLSQELINAVDSWQQGTREATAILPRMFTKRWVRRVQALFFQYTLPLWVAILAVMILFQHFKPAQLAQPLLVEDFRYALGWIFGAFVITVGAFMMSKSLAAYVQSIVKANTPKTRFELTSGDTNKHVKEQSRSIRTIIKVAAGFVGALLCNLLAAYIFAKLWTSK
jgi:hypothetical protein